MKILGIDPGTGRTGWGVINKFSIVDEDNKKEDGKVLEYVAHGCVVTDKKDQMHKRLLVLYKAIRKIIKDYEPDCIVIEQIFFGRNTKTAISVGQARGVAMLSAAEIDVPVFEYTTISVKHSLTGYGRAEKKDMQKIVKLILSKNKRTLPFNSKDKGFDDAADALAIAIHHAFKIL